MGILWDIDTFFWELRNDHISHLGRKGKSSTQKCPLEKGYVIVLRRVPRTQIGPLLLVRV